MIPAATSLSVLRALRILRAARLISAVPSMRKVVGALLAALPSMVGIIGLLVLILYIAAVLATELFGDVVPSISVTCLSRCSACSRPSRGRGGPTSPGR